MTRAPITYDDGNAEERLAALYTRRNWTDLALKACMFVLGMAALGAFVSVMWIALAVISDPGEWPHLRGYIQAHTGCCR